VPVGAAGSAAEVAAGVLGSAAGGAVALVAGTFAAAEGEAGELAAELALLDVAAAELLAGAADSAEQAAAAARTAVPETARTVRRGRTRGAGVTRILQHRGSIGAAADRTRSLQGVIRCHPANGSASQKKVSCRLHGDLTSPPSSNPVLNAVVTSSRRLRGSFHAAAGCSSDERWCGEWRTGGQTTDPGRLCGRYGR